MTSTEPIVRFIEPAGGPLTVGVFHADAAAGNTAATTAAIEQLDAAIAGDGPDRILLRAAAGAGKSYALKRMVEHSVNHGAVARVGVTAVGNKQVFPLAADLGQLLGADRVCLRVSQDWVDRVPDHVRAQVRVAASKEEVPPDPAVILGTAMLYRYVTRHLLDGLGAVDDDGHLFDVLFVDEAWQLPIYLYRQLERSARVVVGVGDVGQLPPIDPGENPWRGDRDYNPFRAWPDVYDGKPGTWAIDLPAVWRPAAAQLPLWRAFYSDWDELHCVAAPGDRLLDVPHLAGPANEVWQAVADGTPVLVEVAGLPEPEAPDVDPPLLAVVEGWLRELLEAGFAVIRQEYDAQGLPTGEVVHQSKDGAAPDGPLIAVLATRNQAVDDAQDLVDRLCADLDLPEGAVVASTVDSWQGQTNVLTIGVHPLSGASTLDEFNSSFGRLAVTCTRATHGLLLVCRAGIDDLLQGAPARPGTPLGEPGPRQLPRQTHTRILSAFRRGAVDLGTG
jgi:hypothetical protein